MISDGLCSLIIRLAVAECSIIIDLMSYRFEAAEVTEPAKRITLTIMVTLPADPVPGLNCRMIPNSNPLLF